MKTSEMIAMLEENPKLKFETFDENLNIRRRVWVTDSGYFKYGIIDQEGNEPRECYLPLGLAFWGNIHLFTDWTLVRKPVPVWEAIKAWKEYGTIKCIHDGKEYVFGTTTAFDSHIAWRLICYGTWYIEDPADE